MDDAANTAEATSEQLTVDVRSGTLARLLRVANDADVTIESLVGDALDFYLDGVGG